MNKRRSLKTRRQVVAMIRATVAAGWEWNAHADGSWRVAWSGGVYAYHPRVGYVTRAGKVSRRKLLRTVRADVAAAVSR